MSTLAHQPDPITRAGYDRLRAELDHLCTVRRRELAQDLLAAREDGTESAGNAGVTAVLEEQSALERRIDELDNALGFVQVVDPPADGSVGIGQRVRIRFADAARAITYELVGALECDPARRRISVDSPVGQALLGRRAGDVVAVATPTGTRQVEIQAVGRGV